MKIQTNSAANNALRNMSINANNTERSIQKLSSGFRINRAADDAAGLAIANQLRSDGKALAQAQRNVSQASAMLQIADGATQTLATIFDRMRELASQGASANVGAQGGKLQDEWDALYTETSRIISSTKYQGTNVLTGLSGTPTSAAVAGTATAGTATASAGFASAVAESGAVDAANGTYTLTSSAAGAVTLTRTGGASQTLTGITDGAGSLDFATLGVVITKNANFVTATAPGSAGSPTAAVTGTGLASAAATASTPVGAYAITIESNGDVTLTNGSDAESVAGGASGAGTLSFATLGITLTTDGSYVAASAANNGTVTGSAGAAAAGFASATSSSTSANGTYTFSNTGDGLLMIDDGNGNSQEVAVTADGAQTVTFASLGISVTLDASFTAATAGGNTSLDGESITVAGAALAVSNSLDGGSVTVTAGAAGAAAGAMSLEGMTLTVAGQAAAVTTAIAAPSFLVGTSASQGSGSYATDDSITVNIGSLSSSAITALGTQNLAAGVTSSQTALTALDAALGALNTFIGKLGAAESRFDSAASTIASTLQNTLAAESAIRDTDMAAEMTSFTKNNILQQAAQSMLAQANQGTQGILQLLRG